MKITIDIECSPREAREFLGLPDIAPLQAAFMQELQEKITKGLSAEESEKLFEMWMKPGLGLAGQTLEKNFEKNMATFQDMFWKMAKSAGAAPGKADDSPKGK